MAFSSTKTFYKMGNVKKLQKGLQKIKKKKKNQQ